LLIYNFLAFFDIYFKCFFESLRFAPFDIEKGDLKAEIKSGETYEAFAKRVNVPLHDILKMNALSNSAKSASEDFYLLIGQNGNVK
jgi:hypothetical protein